MHNFRLIEDELDSGAHNMAVDEAILRAVSLEEAPPTLRLYGWRPPCLSLGCGQRVRDVDSERLRALEWHLVRRLSGGRAILHTDELTYSVALPLTHPLAAGDIVESYRRISTALIWALQRLGAEVQAERLDKRGEIGAVCFETPSHYEITVGGRKLVGSAQVRKHGALLQHGSLPLQGDIARICDALAYADDAAREAAKAAVRERACTLADALGGRVLSPNQVGHALMTGFIEALDVQFTPGALTSDERAHAAELASTVYAHDAWTFRR